jgi:hypothetical protein
MPVFGGKRDISLFRFINRELINKIVDTAVDVYKISLSSTKANLYGESTNKIYKVALRLHCLVHDLREQEMSYEEYGVTVNQNVNFTFLRDELMDKQLVMEAGDIIQWNEKYWEVDTVVENKLFIGKNPDTNKDYDGTHGWDVGITCNTHMTRRTKLNIERARAGNN